MKKILYPADERGTADFGWLKAKYSFSFANYYDPKKVNFGKLRVLNDDIVESGQGFGKHPHDNMEIVTIPLKGELAHKDSTGHEEVIRPDEVQIMSAGTGIVHSEYNYSNTDILNLLQIWVFPKEKNIEPRYDQKKFDTKNRHNTWQNLVSPNKNNGSLLINQDAYFNRMTASENSEFTYKLQTKDNGVYVFLIDGSIEIAETSLNRRDAMGMYYVNQIAFTAEKESDILVIEVPMN